MSAVQRLELSTTALLVVDIQERLMPVIHEPERVVRNTVLLVKAAQVLQLPVLVTTQYAARIGGILPEVAAAIDGFAAVDKMEFDCFRNQNFLQALPTRLLNTFVVCGVETHICVFQTVLGGLAAGNRMWVASDAVSSRTAFNYLDGLDGIRQHGGKTGSTEMIIYELLQRAGTSEFKALLPFLK